MTVRGGLGTLIIFVFFIRGWHTVLILTAERLLLGTEWELLGKGGEGGLLLFEFS